MAGYVWGIVAAVGAAGVAAAQTPAPPRPIAGTLIAVAGDRVSLRAKDGSVVTIEMTPGWTVSVNRMVRADAIVPGAFVASQNVPIDADTGRSIEVRILEPGYRPEEGTHPVSPANPNMMTHGTVRAVSATSGGTAIDVAYPAGTRRLVVAPDVPVTLSSPLAHDVLKPGVAVSGVTRPGADGVARASRLQLAPA